MKVCLGIDASAPMSTVAVLVDGRVSAEERSASGTSGETLLMLVDSVLKQAGLRVIDLSQIAVGIGPGSFTGIRNAIATAQGLASPRHGEASLSVIGVSSLIALGMPVLQESFCFVSVEANSEEDFCACLCAPRATSGIQIVESAFVTSRREVEAHIESLRARLQSGDRTHFQFHRRAYGSQDQQSLAQRTAEASLLAVSEDLGRTERSAGEPPLFQQSVGGRGLRPVYAKPVHAKTLQERGVKSLTSAPDLA